MKNNQRITDASRGLLSSLNRLSLRPVSPSPHGAAPAGSIPTENRARYEKLFMQECQGKPYLTGIEAASIFLASHLPKQVLSSIWEQADFTHDGRFSCDEFCLAMWLIDKERGNYPSTPQHHFPAQNVPAAAHHNTNSWTQPPAYSQQPHHNTEPSHPPYGGPQLAGPLPQATATHAPGHNPYTQPATEKHEMFEPMICQGCDAGLVPEDIVYCCDVCKAGASIFCESCHRGGRRCYHQVSPSKLEAGKKLKNEDKDGDFGFGLKCDGCRTKLKQDALCWHCKRCVDPNFCSDCWRRRDKRCRHAGQGKVQLRRVGKSSVTTEDILDGLEAVGTVLGG